MKWAFDIQVQLDGQSGYLTVARCFTTANLEVVVGVLATNTTGKQLCIVPIPLPPDASEGTGTTSDQMPY